MRLRRSARPRPGDRQLPLKQLIDAGPIAREKRGTYSYYRLAEGALEAVCSLLTAPPVQVAA
ncbi:MAG TPA: hypothetical protein VGL78_03695 [Solirubrobacteraceae bacterium]